MEAYACSPSIGEVRQVECLEITYLPYLVSSRAVRDPVSKTNKKVRHNLKVRMTSKVVLWLSHTYTEHAYSPVHICASKSPITKPGSPVSQRPTTDNKVPRAEATLFCCNSGQRRMTG